MSRTLRTSEAKAFYDKFGAKQDSQSFYEDSALADLMAHSGFEKARHVFEFGCGTGRVARQLLEERLPVDATYEGVDISLTMVGLARSRLEPFGTRAHARQIDGSDPFAGMRERPDRILTTYVLDLLPDEHIKSFFDGCARVLPSAGRVCVASLTFGRTAGSRIVTTLWEAAFKLSPSAVGGCRPIRVAPYLDATTWSIVHHTIVSSFGVASEILVASRL